MRRTSAPSARLALVAALAAARRPQPPLAAGAGAAKPDVRSLDGFETGRRAELRPTVPIADRAGEKTALGALAEAAATSSAATSSASTAR